MKTFLVAAAFLVLAVPAALAVPPAGHGNAGKNGNKPDTNTTTTTATTTTSVEKNAAKACKAERASLGADAFAAKYGTNPNKKNAFGKCVSKLAKAKSKSGSGTD